MKQNIDLSAEKKKIYFARTYRHLKVNPREYLVFLLLFILPAIIALLFLYDELTYILCKTASWVITAASGENAGMMSDTFLPGFGPVYSLSLPTTLPDYNLILLNFGVSLTVAWLLCTGTRKGRPMSIYLSITLFIHIIACAFFLLGKNVFPYTLEEFSDLYIKQQVGIWITFLLLIGLVMGLLSRGALLRRLLTTMCVMLYSFAFALVRYVLFLYVLMEFSILYMPLMFFALGPFFDFSYFVAIYAVSTNGIIRLYDSKQKEEWFWA